MKAIKSLVKKAIRYHLDHYGSDAYAALVCVVIAVVLILTGVLPI